MAIFRFLLVLTLLFAAGHPAFAGLLSEPTVGGHLKTFNIGYEKAPSSILQNGFFSANSQRFELKGNLSDSIDLEFALENLLLYSDPPAQITLPTDSPNQKVDLTHDWNRDHRWSDRLRIDRLALKGRFTNFDWSLGRQAIGFGRIVIFSPLDVVAPFAPDALDSDNRPGVDALRVVHYFGLGGQIGATVVFGTQPENNSYLLTLSDNRSGIDLLGIGGILRDRELIGLGLAGNLGPLGVKIEAGHYNGKNFGLPGGDLHEEFTIGALELWYRFPSGMVLLSQYLYNGAGASSPIDYAAAATSATFQEGLSFLLGQQYLLLGPSWELHPLATLSGLLIWNIDDNSALIRPQIKFSLGNNLSLDLFYSFNSGKKPQTVAPSIFIPQSEFGSAADSGGLLLRWYF